MRRADETDRKVADHIREYGHVTNQTLRRMFDVDVAGARDLLRALQQRGVIVKLDQGRGGPGIRYGRGPKMPRGRQPRLEVGPRASRPISWRLTS